MWKLLQKEGLYEAHRSSVTTKQNIFWHARIE